MKKIFVIAVILLTITACGSNNLSGLYECDGAYKSLEFNNGKVVVDLGFIKKQGTYEIKGNNVALTLDGKTLVLESISVDSTPLAIKAEDFVALTSPMIQCKNIEFMKLQKEAFLKTPEGAELMKTPEGREYLK